MARPGRSGNWGGRLARVVASVGLVAMAGSSPAVAGGNGSGRVKGASASGQEMPERPRLIARVSRWEGDPVHKVKAPEGFDLSFRLIGGRFDGTFKIEGLPQNVPEGAAFDVQLRLFNLGDKKRLKVSSITVVGDGMMLITDLMVKKVGPRSAETVASFRVPPQSSVGSSFLITVILSNGDRHLATLSFTPPA